MVAVNSRANWSRKQNVPMRHNDTAQATARWHTKVQIGSRVQWTVCNCGQFTFRIIIDVQNGWPTFWIDRCGRLTCFEQFNDTLYGQHDATLWNIDNHAHRRQCCDQILWMRRSNCNWRCAQIQATVECTNQIQTGRENQCNMIARINFATFLQKCGNFFSSFV